MKKLIFALFALICLASCQQKTVVYINGAEAVAVEYKPGPAERWQLRYMPYNEAQHFVDSVGAYHYDIIYQGVIISSK